MNDITETIAYELMYIVPTSYTDEELGTVETHVTELLTKNGAQISETKRLGKMQFAYPIRHEQFGHYVLVEFQALPSAILGIEEGLRLQSKEVLRHIIVKREELGENNYTLIPFQPVTVEMRDRRKSRTPKPEKQVDTVKAKEELKAGVSALEKGQQEEKPATEEPEKISAEQLEKKIDEALDEKSA